MGKLYDDCGNRMSPSFSTKNGVRHRFYVSSALLRGRKTEIGSVGRSLQRRLKQRLLRLYARTSFEDGKHRRLI
jgi:site-specific DNA recombinase